MTLPPSPFTFAEARAAGVPRRALDHALRSGALVRVCRGVYAAAQLLDAARPPWELVHDDHLQRLAEALRRFPGCVASHSSAALVHGLELVISAATPVHLTVVDTVPTSRKTQGLRIHHTDSTDTPYEVVDGLRVTPVDRTAADVLRTRRAPHSVAMLDRALVSGTTTLERVEAELDAQHRWTGRPRALQALDLTDPVRESWLESYSFISLHLSGLLMAVPQVEIFDESFRFVGRVDGLWARQRTFGEADGEGKYFLGPDDMTMSDRAEVALEAEQVRHARLEELGLVGVRWTGAQMMASPDVVRRRVEEAMGRGLRMTFRGWVRHEGTFMRLDEMARRHEQRVSSLLRDPVTPRRRSA